MVEGEVRLPKGYLPQLENEISRLHQVMLVEGRYQTGMSMRKLGVLKQELLGKLNFAGMVMGPGSPEVLKRAEQYEAALLAREEFRTVRWLEIPYNMEF